MDNIDKINVRLEKLREYLADLKPLQGISVDKLAEDKKTRLFAERCLQLCIEAALDIAELIIVEQRLPMPEHASDAILQLGESGILDKGFAKHFAKTAGFRNILVHDYLTIDYKYIAAAINDNLGDFEKYMKAIVTFVRE